MRSAVPLDEEQRQRLDEALSKATGKTVDVKVIVDPTVVGGIYAKVGDQVIDATVRKRLQELKESASEADDVRPDDHAGRHRGRPAQAHRRLEADAPRSRRSAACSRPVTASRASPGSRTAWRTRSSSSRTTCAASRSTSRSTTVGAIVLGDASQLQEGDPVRQTGRILSVGVGDALLGRVVNALGEPIDDKGPIEAETIRPLEVQAASVVERQPVNEPLQTGIKAIDAMTNVGRGQRELIIGDRQTGKTAIGIDAIINQRSDWGTPNAGQVHLRRRRTEGVVRSRDPGAARRDRRDGVHGDRRRRRVRPGSLPLPRAVRGRRDRRALDVQGRARAHRVRRPVQAGRRVPSALAAAPPSAGPRGVPGRRLLPALPSARARGEAVGRPRRRLAHRAADRRDQGRRHLGLHPDERHLDHRRPDLPRDRPLLPGRAPGGERRDVGQPRRWCRADQGDEEDRRTPASRPRVRSASSRRSRSSAPTSTSRRRTC